MFKIKLTKRKSNKKEENIWVKRDCAMMHSIQKLRIEKSSWGGGGSVSLKLIALCAISH